MKYCLDASGIIDGYNRFFRPENFPTLWEKLDQMARQHQFIMPLAVLGELSKKSDGAYGWVKEREAFLVRLELETDAVYQSVQEITEQFPRLNDPERGKNFADPFVIALAQLTGTTIITGERGGGTRRPKIPFICNMLNVPCIAFEDIIRVEGWVF